MMLPTITTIIDGAWREKIREIKELGLKEVSAFVTCLDKKEREELYALAKEAGIKKFPFVHLRPNDMETSEVDYLVKEFGAEVFNVHTQKEFPISFDYTKYRDMRKH